jgi:integrase
MPIELLSEGEVRRLSKRDPVTALDSRPAKARLYHDGGGLYFRVARPVGQKNDRFVCSWVFRYRDVVQRTKNREMGLGPYPDVDLATARQKARDARLLRMDHRDPLAAREAVREALRLEQAQQITFEQCGKQYIDANKSEWKNEKHRQQWTNTLSTYAYPIIGALQIKTVDTPLVLRVLRQMVETDTGPKPLWNARPETAGRLRGRIETILEWARVNGHRTGDNPARWAGELEHSLPERKDKQNRRHHASLPWNELGSFMPLLREQEGIAASALDFTILTVARTGETIGMKWPEVNFETAIWTIPGERMKSGREHRVPLSDAALAVLQRRHKATGGRGFVFPSRDGEGALSNMAMLQLLKRMKRDELTTHGFRSTFRVWVSETRKHDGDLAEMALAHVEENKTKAAYNRTDMLAERRKLMDAWARLCAGAKTAKVVNING